MQDDSAGLVMRRHLIRQVAVAVAGTDATNGEHHPYRAIREGPEGDIVLRIHYQCLGVS